MATVYNYRKKKPERLFNFVDFLPVYGAVNLARRFRDTRRIPDSRSKMEDYSGYTLVAAISQDVWLGLGILAYQNLDKLEKLIM